MQQLNAYRFYELGAKLHGLFSATAQGRVADMFVPLTEAQALLDGFIKGAVFIPDASKEDAERLLNKIGSVFERYFIDPSSRQIKTPTGEDRIDTQELSLVRALVEKFEHALAAELNRAPTYLASKRGIYSTYDLAENAQKSFPASLQGVIPELSQEEFATAGRALAFGLGTAAAMHMLRAVDAMTRVYYDHFASEPLAKNERSFSVYVKKLTAMVEEDGDGVRPDRRAVQMLAQIKEHYRNPLVAPDCKISADEATQLFGMAGALIVLMGEQISSRKRDEDIKSVEDRAMSSLAKVAEAANEPASSGKKGPSKAG
ncbi:MAG: hypothetical protein ABTQ34_01835 [Bdellovibrionales bacterium]